MGFQKKFISDLRNSIPINDVVTRLLNMEYKHREGNLRFLCPLCSDFHTSTKESTNLARCFRCRKNFNPIDLTMAHRELGFKETCLFLTPFLAYFKLSAQREDLGYDPPFPSVL